VSWRSARGVAAGAAGAAGTAAFAGLAGFSGLASSPGSSPESGVCAYTRRPGSNSPATARGTKPSLDCLLLRSWILIAWSAPASTTAQQWGDKVRDADPGFPAGPVSDKRSSPGMGTTREYLQWLSEPSVWLRAKVKKRPAGNSFW